VLKRDQRRALATFKAERLTRTRSPLASFPATSISSDGRWPLVDRDADGQRSFKLACRSGHRAVGFPRSFPHGP